jgi:hypothetical protein
VRIWYPDRPIGNFGDDLNLWVWPRAIPDLLDDDGRIVLIGIGSILGEGLPAAPLKVVVGAGAGRSRVPKPGPRWRFYSVRGPVTVSAVGLSPEHAAIDPGAMVARHLRRIPASERDGVVFMPHNVSILRAGFSGWDIAEASRRAGVRFLSGREPVDEILATIGGARLLLAEAMHGAIVADALRTPWVPIASFGHVFGRKWQDWTSSLGLTYGPHVIDCLASSDPAGDLQRLLEDLAVEPGMLSRDAAFDAAMRRLDAAIDRLRADHRSGELARAASDIGARPPDDARLRRRLDFLDNIRRHWQSYHNALLTAVRSAPEGGSLVLIDDDAWGAGERLLGRTIHHSSGLASASAFLAELEDFKSRGASIAVVGGQLLRRGARPEWLYPTLDRRWRLTRETEDLAIWDLRQAPGITDMLRTLGRPVRRLIAKPLDRRTARDPES